MHIAPKPETVEDFLSDGCGRCDKAGTPQCKVVDWLPLLKALRAELKKSALTEQIKWGSPCYSHKAKNILMLTVLNDCVVISFFSGAQLIDDKNLLDKPGENSRFARYLRFTELEQIEQKTAEIGDFILQAIDLPELVSGKKTEANLPSFPEELIQAFEADAEYQQAFDKLTMGRKRGYLLHFNGAKQAKTRMSRIAKSRDNVMAGKGRNEYKRT